MGSFSELTVSDYPVYSTKNGIDPFVMTIFRESDKKVFERRISERNPLVSGHLEGEEEVETVYEYSNTALNIRDRLDVMGFSFERAKRDFEAALEEELERLEEMGKSTRELQFKSHLLQQQKMLENSKFRDWLDALRQIIEKKIVHKKDASRGEHLLIEYLVDEHSFLQLNYPCTDLRYLLRVLVEICPGECLVTQDLTELVNAGYYNPDDSVCELALAELTGEYPIAERIIILTEGSTDRVILEQSLRLLYPHLLDYYSFMDFGLSNAAGGASSLVSTVKAFIGSGIRNRVVAIFDNDTSGEVATRGLNRSTIPGNIKILNYPVLETAKQYPTLGPGGISLMDINGLACSIELYLGTDVLERDGELIPVQWKGYDPSVRRYQGEILFKRELQDAFLAKCKKCSEDSQLLKETDWEPLRLVWKTIFGAFN